MTIDRQDILDASLLTWSPPESRNNEQGAPEVSLVKPFTLYLRARLGLEATDILSLLSMLDARLSCSFRRMIVDGVSVFVCKFWTDFNDDPLQLMFPENRFARQDVHHFVLRYTGPHLQVFVDGVLADEEWPTGSFRGGSLFEIQPHAEGVAVAVWNRALTDDEIVALSGGAASVAGHEIQMLGEEQPQLQYWRPRGYRTGVGDCMPFWHSNRFHLFYLFDRHSHNSKWDKGAHQWAHCSTTDLKHWEHHPLAIAITEEGEGSICTGSVFFWDGVYYAFYAVRTLDGSPAPIKAAVGADGISFQKTPGQTFLTEPYLPQDVRDPVVFRDEASHCFRMLVTTGLRPDVSVNSRGCLAQLVSDDLVTWREQNTFFQSGIDSEADWNAQPECPDYFRWGDWYYLLFGVDGHTHYRMSRASRGPWTRPKVHTLDSMQLKVIKTAEFAGGRRIAAGFVNEGHYAGDVVFREVRRNSDGTLGTSFVAEMIPNTGEAIPLDLQGADGDVDCGQGHCISQGLPETVARVTEALPSDCRIRMRITAERGTSAFGISLGSAPAATNRLQLRFDPDRERVEWLRPGSDQAAAGNTAGLSSVTGLYEPLILDLIRKGDLLDVCLSDARTMIVRHASSVQASCLHLFAEGGRVTFSELEIRPLLGSLA